MQYVKLQVWTMRMPFFDPRLADGIGSMHARPSGITRHLHFTVGACPPELFARGLCHLGPSDPRSGETAGTHDRGQTGVLDQWWSWLRS